jgi:hypothetical protein
MPKKHIMLLGPPASGKGTFAKKLKKLFNVVVGLCVSFTASCCTRGLAAATRQHRRRPHCSAINANYRCIISRPRSLHVRRHNCSRIGQPQTYYHRATRRSDTHKGAGRPLHATTAAAAFVDNACITTHCASQ